MEKTEYFVVQNQQGEFLAIDSHSGGYPWYPEDMGCAKLFKASDRSKVPSNEGTQYSGMHSGDVLFGSTQTAGKQEAAAEAGITSSTLYCGCSLMLKSSEH